MDRNRRIDSNQARVRTFSSLPPPKTFLRVLLSGRAGGKTCVGCRERRYRHEGRGVEVVTERRFALLAVSATSRSGRYCGVCRGRRGFQSGDNRCLASSKNSQRYARILHAMVSTFSKVEENMALGNSMGGRVVAREHSGSLWGTVSFGPKAYEYPTGSETDWIWDWHRKACHGDTGTVFKVDKGGRMSHSIHGWVDHTMGHPRLTRGERIVGERNTS